MRTNDHAVAIAVFLFLAATAAGLLHVHTAVVCDGTLRQPTTMGEEMTR